MPVQQYIDEYDTLLTDSERQGLFRDMKVFALPILQKLTQHGYLSSFDEDSESMLSLGLAFYLETQKAPKDFCFGTVQKRMISMIAGDKTQHDESFFKKLLAEIA